MRSFRPARILRLTLAISVSLWMAGAGCLLGCSNAVSAAPELSKDEPNTVVAKDSCAAKKSHDCCAKRAKQEATQNIQQTKQLLFTEIKARPETPKDCPMATGASAVVSKAKGDGPDESLARELPMVVPHELNRFSKSRSSASLLLNRGPTYLRCCVFLI